MKISKQILCSMLCLMMSNAIQSLEVAQIIDGNYEYKGKTYTPAQWSAKWKGKKEMPSIEAGMMTHATKRSKHPILANTQISIVQLNQALIHDNLEALKNFISDNPEFKWTNRYYNLPWPGESQTPLSAASWFGAYNCVKYLLHHNIGNVIDFINMPSSHGYTALDYAHNPPTNHEYPNQIEQNFSKISLILQKYNPTNQKTIPQQHLKPIPFNPEPKTKEPIIDKKKLLVSMPNLKQNTNVFISTTYVDSETKEQVYGYDYNGDLNHKKNYITINIPETLDKSAKFGGCTPPPGLGCWRPQRAVHGEAEVITIVISQTKNNLTNTTAKFNIAYSDLSSSYDGQNRLEIKENTATLFKPAHKPAPGSKIEERFPAPIFLKSEAV